MEVNNSSYNVGMKAKRPMLSWKGVLLRRGDMEGR
ncbi:hypothetical protein A2U01_0063791, partial [Trifolium medium]|nr:hypothetical protein [Trifolium medium]